MPQYKLQLELVFNSQTDADKLMDACEPLVTQASNDRHQEVNQLLRENIEKSLTQAHADVQSAIQSKAKLADALRGCLNELESIRKQQSECVEAVNAISTLFNNTVAEANRCRAVVDKIMSEADNTVQNERKNLNDFEEQIARAKQYIEASDFVHDMIDVHHNIVTGGTVKLIWRDPSKEGEKWFPQKEWTFNRDKST